MQLDVRFHGIDHSNALAEQVSHQAHAAFSRFGRLLRRVRIRFNDQNGPRGGVDKRCSVEVRGPFGVRVFEAEDVDFGAAAHRALQRAENAVSRAVHAHHS